VRRKICRNATNLQREGKSKGASKLLGDIFVVRYVEEYELAGYWTVILL